MSLPSTAEQFLRDVRAVRLVDEPRLTECVATGADKAETERPDALADRLVQANLLTRFQADQLLAGRARWLTIAGYTVLQPEAEDELGTAFLCRDEGQRQVVLRALPKAKQADPATVQRFQHEADTAAALEHPNFARIFPTVQQDGIYYLPTEHVAGVTLQTLVQQDGPLPLCQALDYLYQAASGVGHAHAAGVAHRDLKPRNLRVDAVGTVKVLNVGLARFFHDDEDILTNKYDENVLGTVDYLAPE